jgi:hypothetical protein
MLFFFFKGFFKSVRPEEEDLFDLMLLRSILSRNVLINGYTSISLVLLSDNAVSKSLGGTIIYELFNKLPYRQI